MKTSSLLLLGAILLSACVDRHDGRRNQLEARGDTQKENQSSVRFLKNQLKNSLIRLDTSPEIRMEDDSSKYVLFTTTFNKRRIGIIAITDSVLFLFQQMNTNWVQTDSAQFEDYALRFDATDLNGDYIDDLILYGFGNMHGQLEPYVFITDSMKFLHYRADIKLYNIRYDPIRKLAKSHYQGGPFSVHHKELHRWQGDSLHLVMGVEQDCSGEKIITRFYRKRNGKNHYFKTLKDPADYDSALWKEGLN